MSSSSVWKRFLCGVLCAALVGSSGCSTTEDPPDGTPPAPDYGTTTLMVYMVGSDLESKGGSGTADLEEMAASGVDLNVANVVVCAGGCEKWHNDVAQKDKLTTMHLTADGFVVDRASDAVSMGDPAPLAEFLTYAHDTYPADNYALILWDHGMGPVIGYGKDMLFDKAALTLADMKEALDASPFGGDTKLDFVGFDACLMASAELACVWDAYADYLIASQEVEPSGGWDYTVLKDLGKTDTLPFTQSIVSGYIAACEVYFTERGFDGREATLSCLDLSKTATLETAVNALFTAANSEIHQQYNAIAVNRVDTRAFGRASTGSEYDLVDLADMATQLSALYPDETSALLAAVNDMVVHNLNNTENCCGMSLYYPFFNKDYYTSEWSAAYAALGVFDSYRQYLNGYAKHWLAEDFLENAKSVAPETDGKGSFTLTLSEEQAKTVATASFYVFEQESEGVYQPIFASKNIERQGNTLSARFDGNIVYGKSFDGIYFHPALYQRDTVGDTTRYAVSATLSTSSPADLLTDFNNTINTHAEYLLSVNDATGDVAISGISPVSDDSLVTGKTEDLNPNDYYSLFFPQFSHYYLTRYDNGVIKPFSEWVKTGTITGYSLYAADGVSFETAPLTTGTYAFLYEITDTQGNTYCSELTSFAANGVLPDADLNPAPVTSTWESGNEWPVYDADNVTVSLFKRRGPEGEKLHVKVDNRNDFPVKIETTDTTVNGNIAVDATVCYGEAAANQVTVGNGLAFSDIDQYIDINALSSLSFTLQMRNVTSGKTMTRNQVVTVNFTDESHLSHYESNLIYESYSAPYLGAYAEEQTIYDKDGVSVKLLRFAAKETGNDARFFFMFTNTSHTEVRILVTGMTVGDVYMPSLVSITDIPSGQTTFGDATLFDQDCEAYMIDAIHALDLHVIVEQNDAIINNKLCRVKLTEAADSTPAYTEGDTVMLDEQGVRMTLLECKKVYDSFIWRFAVVNNSGESLSFKTARVLADGEDITSTYSAIVESEGIPQNCRGVIQIRYTPDNPQAPKKQLAFTLHRLDFDRTQLFDTFDTVITLDVPS